MGVQAQLPAKKGYWNAAGRWIVFLLAATSIACLLFDFYHLCPMRAFTLYIFLPALAVLSAFAVLDRQGGDGRLWRAVWLGLIGGLLAAVAYDIFRLPFVFSKQWGLASFVPTMDLFKVFPRFGAMILGEPLEQAHYSTPTQLVGWLYHFSNGATLGVMYVAMIGSPTRRSWLWAVLMALGLELGMLLTPYPQVFGIAVTLRFIMVTMAAHAIFGAGLGQAVKRLGTSRWFVSPVAT